MTTASAGTDVAGPRAGDRESLSGQDAADLRRPYDDFSDGHLVPLFRFSDTPILERLHQDRVSVAGRQD